MNKLPLPLHKSPSRGPPQQPGPRGHHGALATQATYVPAGHIRRFFEISVPTLKRWAETGDIGYVRCSDGKGKRLYNFADVQRKFGIDPAADYIGPPKSVVGYARVSSAKQREDLTRQITAIRDAIREGEAGPEAQAISDEIEIVGDVGRGLNWKRKGLKRLLERVIQGDVGTIVVLFKDRLCRFAFELVEWVCQQHGCRIIVVHGHQRAADEQDADNEPELADDLFAVINVFVARHNGLRAAQNARSQSQSRGNEKEADGGQSGQTVSGGGKGGRKRARRGRADGGTTRKQRSRRSGSEESESEGSEA